LLSLKIRPAREGDAAGLAKVHVDSWREAYRGIISDATLAQLSYPSSQSRWERILSAPNEFSFHYIAEVKPGEIIGFSSGGPERDGNPDYQAELYALYLLQAYHRQGIGSWLVAATAGGLLARGMDSMYVWVLTKNPAVGFYKAMGGIWIGERRIEIAGQQLMEDCYGWPNLKLLPGVEVENTQV